MGQKLLRLIAAGLKTASADAAALVDSAYLKVVLERVTQVAGGGQVKGRVGWAAVDDRPAAGPHLSPPLPWLHRLSIRGLPHPVRAGLRGPGLDRIPRPRWRWWSWPRGFRWVVFALVGGAVSDRFSRRTIVLATDLVRGLTQATTATVLLAGIAEVWMLVALQLVAGAGTAFFNRAAHGILPSVVDPPRLQQVLQPDTVHLQAWLEGYRGTLGFVTLLLAPLPPQLSKE